MEYPTQQTYNAGSNQGQNANQAMASTSAPDPGNKGSQPKLTGSGRSVQISNLSGRKKALLIGINYYGTKAALRGCINDVINVQNFICTYYHFSLDSMIILTDDQTNNPGRMPTRANIIQAMQWLVADAHPNDSLFFHYSGHGSQQRDQDGDEADGYDETICPLDYASAGMIVDDDMNEILVQPLPQGCRLTAIFDCCHSGTALDLPYTYDQHGQLVSYSSDKGFKTTIVDVGKKYLTGDFFGALQTLKMSILSLSTIQRAEEVSQTTRGTQADVVMFSG
ncbi:Ca(2+)-dependent cysteine protease [Entomophthora muscae]|uniref:Ca(2+)-dependent cysteine protease n=1 Tax=Entomophthora muscae TaxID=34485 RepID=A0ACC2RH33_9FUNG|nr:Ca(2+)-dependent cysteine protease [Entomophthora muscae]